MPQTQKLFGALAILFFISFLLPLFLPVTIFASILPHPSLPIDVFVIFWGYRWLDIIFLAIVVFAAIIGISSLFREEKAGIPIEEVVTEGYVEEIEEEE